MVWKESKDFNNVTAPFDNLIYDVTLFRYNWISNPSYKLAKNIYFKKYLNKIKMCLDSLKIKIFYSTTSRNMTVNTDMVALFNEDNQSNMLQLCET